MDISVTNTVQQRYGAGAEEREAALCCPVDYDARYLEAIPAEVIERDYGCGDPSRYVGEGETVLDLGSGSGKVCFIAAQKTGPKGRVIGIDMTPEMLDLARRSAAPVAERIGYANVEFRRGNIEDLASDPARIDAWLADHPVTSAGDMAGAQTELERMRREQPLVADDSIDLIVSNCVLNLVSDDKKRQLFAEMFRVLKVGGRIAVSDIVSDEPSPEHLKNDPELWSGCVSGAFQEHAFLAMLEEVGFHGITFDKFDERPWRVVEGIEYRAVTVLAWKGKQGPCIEGNQAVIYRGPWKTVEDDDGHVYRRGQRMAVCEKTWRLLNAEPYRQSIIPLPPHRPVVDGGVFDCSRPVLRDPSETKQGSPRLTTEAAAACCDIDGGCC